MRFDADRALALARSFDTLRLAGGDAERAAAENLAGELSRAGWNVRAGELAGLRTTEPTGAEIWTMAITAIVSGILLQLTTGSVPGLLSPWTLAAIFGALAVAALILRLMVFTRRRGGLRTAPYVSAEPSSGLAERAGTPGRQPPRVVLLTHLDTRPPLGSLQFRRDLGFLDLVWLAALWVPCLLVGGLRWLSTAGPALLIGLGLINLVRRVDPWIQRAAPYPADNRTGLAMLVELARSWPPELRQEVEIRLLALGASPASKVALLRDLFGAEPGHETATLVINLEAPGVGEVLTLSGHGEALHLAELAARDLWLPVRTHAWRLVPLDHRPIQHVYPAVSLVGDLDSSSIEPPLLAATAQLTTEMVLRWARRQQAP